jgi:uncharacterized protein
VLRIGGDRDNHHSRESIQLLQDTNVSHPHRVLTCFILTACLGINALSLASSGPVAAGAPTNVQPGYVLPDTETWDLTTSGGEAYRIFVSHPAGEPPAEGFPVLYVLDGNTIFGSFAEARRLQEVSDPEIGKTLIVGVGYPDGAPYDYKRRMKDFTPPFPDPMPAAETPFAKWDVGGQDNLARFLLDDLRSAVAGRYKINLHRQALFGHSLGGLFALHMLYRHPEAFVAIIAASPSIWWNDQGILAEEREFSAHLASGRTKGALARLLLVVGGREETRAEQWDAGALARRLEPLSAYGLRSQYETFGAEPHLGVPTRAITDAMRFAFAWP